MPTSYVMENGEWVEATEIGVTGQTVADAYVMIDGEWVSFYGQFDTFTIDDFETSLDPYHIVDTPRTPSLDGGTYEAGGLTEAFSIPGEGLDNYPHAGDMHRLEFSMEALGYDENHWYVFLFGGDPGSSSDRFPRYEVHIGQQENQSPPTMHIQARTESDSWEAASSNSGNIQSSRQYTLIFTWYYEPDDGRTGAAADLYETADFDVDGLDASPVVSVDTQDRPASNTDGSEVLIDTDDFDNKVETWGRFGVRTEGGAILRLDNAEIIRESSDN